MPLDKWYPTCCPHFLPRGKEMRVMWNGHTSVNSSVHALLMRANGGLSNNLHMHKRTILSNAWLPRIYTSQLTREAKFSSPPSSVQSMLWPAYHSNLANSTWQSLSRRAVRQTAKPTLINPIGTYSRTGVRGRLNNIVQRLARASIRCQKIGLLYKDPICTICT